MRAGIWYQSGLDVGNPFSIVPVGRMHIIQTHGVAGLPAPGMIVAAPASHVHASNVVDDGV